MPRKKKSNLRAKLEKDKVRKKISREKEKVIFILNCLFQLFHVHFIVGALAASRACCNHFSSFSSSSFGNFVVEGEGGFRDHDLEMRNGFWNLSSFIHCSTYLAFRVVNYESVNPEEL